MPSLIANFIWNMQSVILYASSSLTKAACTKVFVYVTGVSSEEGSGIPDRQNICHEGLEKGTLLWQSCNDGNVDVLHLFSFRALLYSIINSFSGQDSV